MRVSLTALTSVFGVAYMYALVSYRVNIPNLYNTMYMYMYGVAMKSTCLNLLPRTQKIAGSSPARGSSSFSLEKKELSSGVVACICLVSITDYSCTCVGVCDILTHAV